jgi:hypothetical protein
VSDHNDETESSGTPAFAVPTPASEKHARPTPPALRIVPPSRKVRLLKLLLLQVAILSTTSACTALEDGSDTDPALDFAFEGKPFDVQWEFAKHSEARWEYTPTELTMVCDQTSTEAAETQPFVDCVL